MLIAINGQILFSEKHINTGPYVYIYNLIKNLAKIDKENRYIIYLSEDAQFHEQSIDELTCGNRNFEFVVLKKKISWTQVSLAIRLFEDNPDVYFTSVHTLPILRPFKTRVVAMIHGLEYKYSPVSRSIRGLIEVFPIWYTALFCKSLIVPSIATIEAILKRLPFVKKGKMSILYEGISEIYRKRSEDEILAVQEKYGLKGIRYLMFISTIQPRKNVPKTVEAFSALAKQPEFADIKLCLAGRLGWLYDESVSAPTKFGVEDKVSFLGRVPDSDLPALLSGAAAYVNFSFEEGFGLTVLEAMSCEIPCAVSDIPAHREVAEDCAFYANPKEVVAIQNAIKQALNLSQQQKEALTKDAKRRAALFSWHSNAQETLKILKGGIKISL